MGIYNIFFLHEEPVKKMFAFSCMLYILFIQFLSKLAVKMFELTLFLWLNTYNNIFQYDLINCLKCPKIIVMDL